MREVRVHKRDKKGHKIFYEKKMQTIMPGLVFKGLGVIERYTLKIKDKQTALKVIAKLNNERNKMINCLKRLKAKNEIGSICIPKNRGIQEELDEIVEAKKLIKESVQKITEIFCK